MTVPKGPAMTTQKPSVPPTASTPIDLFRHKFIDSRHATGPISSLMLPPVEHCVSQLIDAERGIGKEPVGEIRARHWFSERANRSPANSPYRHPHLYHRALIPTRSNASLDMAAKRERRFLEQRLRHL